MKREITARMDPEIGGQEEESLQKLRAALGTPHGTSSEKRERVLSAWSTLRSASHPVDEGKKQLKKKERKEDRKRSRHVDGSKRSAKKKSKVEEGRTTSGFLIKEEKTKLLHDAARMGQADRIRELAESGVKITSKDDSGFTALHWASLYGHTEVVRALLGLGAGDGKRINRKTDTGNTALHLACMGRHAQVALMLQLYKADEYTANLCGQTPVSLGLRDLVENVSRTQRLDAAQTQRELARGSLLYEISDWHLRRYAESSVTPAHDIIEIRKKPLRGFWSTWEDYDTAWRAFVSKFTSMSADKLGGPSSASDTLEGATDSQDTIRFHDVPWPVIGLQLLPRNQKTDDQNEGQERLLLAEVGASGATLRSLVQQERLRWHPDKFLQMFGRHLSSVDRNAVLGGVQTVIQLLNSLASEAEDDTV